MASDPAIDPRERMKRHVECIADGRFPVVFCVRCGSTCIDQNFIHELRCYDCGNSLPWDGLKFSINRYAADATDPGRLNDAARAFVLEAKR